MRVFGWYMLLAAGYIPTYQTVDFDYTEYLGEGYEKAKVNETPTIVTNHQGTFEAF